MITRYTSAYVAVVVLTTLAFAGLFALLFSPAGRDDTDPPRGGHSGMNLHIDARTGCHYLSRRDGGLTPRLQADGRQLCEGA